jgi:hypothetical protein
VASKLRVTSWRAPELVARVSQVLEDFGPYVAFQAEQEIAKDQYDWPLFRTNGTKIVTERNNGESVTSPRNILDTGFLMNSATAPQVSIGSGSASLRIVWTAPYAYEVLKGGYVIGTRKGSYVAKERDWIAKTYAQLRPGGERPFLPFLVQRWNQLAARR